MGSEKIVGDETAAADPAGFKPLRLILMGTGPFAVPAFEAICDRGHQVALVVTRPVREVKSRKGPPPSPVREFAAARRFDVYDPPSINTPDAIEQLRSFAADLLVVCDFGQILSNDALATARLGGINLHGSLLPAYRGAAPVQWAVLSGDAVTGVSVIHMTPRLDGGPILASAQTEIGRETSGELEHRLSRLGIEPTLRSVDELAAWDGVSPIGQPQDASKVSRAPRLDKAAGRIDWSKSARQIDCHVRGMQPWPGAFTDLNWSDRPAVRIAVKAVTAIEDGAVNGGKAAEPGTLIDESELRITTGDGLIRIDRLQVAGRAEVSAEEFLRGHRLPILTRFGPATAGAADSGD
jgi:methionyl-tRNA formyltransferase